MEGRIWCMFCAVVVILFNVVSAKKGVFHPVHTGGHVENIEEAEKVCTDSGARIATLIELTKHRFDLMPWTCGCGWLYKGQIYDPGCGEERVLTKCTDNPADYGLDGFDTYCFGDLPELPPGVPTGAFNTGTGYLYMVENSAGRYKIKSVADGLTLCQANGNAVVATLTEMKLAFAAGFEYCSCGWIADGSVALPMHKYIPGCGPAGNINKCPKDYTAWKKWGWGDGWNVYCYRKYD